MGLAFRAADQRTASALKAEIEVSGAEDEGRCVGRRPSPRGVFRPHSRHQGLEGMTAGGIPPQGQTFGLEVPHAVLLGTKAGEAGGQELALVVNNARLGRHGFPRGLVPWNAKVARRGRVSEWGAGHHEPYDDQRRVTCSASHDQSFPFGARF